MRAKIAFQHAVLLFTQGICSFIPDTPGSVKLQIQRENLLQRENLFKEQKRQIKDENAKTRFVTAGEQVVRVLFMQSCGKILTRFCERLFLILRHKPWIKRVYSTGWPISWRTWVELTLFLALPPSAWFCLG